MCPPFLAPIGAALGASEAAAAAAGTMAVLSVAATAASAGVSYAGQKQAADSQKYQYEEAQRLAQENLQLQYQQIGVRQREEQISKAQQVQQIRGHAGGVEQGDRLGSDQRRLLGRFGQHRVTGGQRGGDLAGENGQREVPGADADEYTASMQAELVGLAHRAAQGLGAGKLRLGQLGVVATEVDRLAHL